MTQHSQKQILHHFLKSGSWSTLPRALWTRWPGPRQIWVLLCLSIGHVHPSSWGRRICWPGHRLRDLPPEWPAVLHDSWHCPRGRQQPGNLGGPGIFAAEKAKEATSAVRLCPETSVLTSLLLRGTSSYHLVHFFLINKLGQTGYFL